MQNKDRIYLITDIPGLTPQIGRLISMMNYARHTTLEAVEGLTQQQLDYLLDPQSNSIGALLLHFAAVEYAYQVSTFEGRRLNEDEAAEWETALDLGDAGREKIRSQPLGYYLGKLEAVRNRTYDLFRSVDDSWLYEQEAFWYGKQANRYFMWFHVFEDEISHRGQIRLIRNRLPHE